MTTFYRVTVEAFFTTDDENDVVPAIEFNTDETGLPKVLRAMADTPENLMAGIAKNLNFPGSETLRPMTKTEFDEYLADQSE